ncbi:MAG: asparagine--tRNA ligase [Oscillospiraceae bacterium]|nr:asparagine--tRNA ligase [Oscillospiraceae bacterium]
MKRQEIASLYQKELTDGQPVTVSGWAKTVRDSKNIGFIELSDGSCFKNLQVVFEAAKLENYKEIAKAGAGTSMTVCGRVVLTPSAKQPFELNADSVQIDGVCPPEYPLQKKRHSMEFLRTMPHLRPRTNTFSAAFRVRSTAAYAIHKFFNENGFVYVHTPLITGSDCEGAGEMFRVTTLDMENPPRTDDGKVDFSQDFFGRGTNLTVSGQLEAEGFATAFGKVYTFGPTFRAEKSNTPRHAAEFWMIEPEIAFADLADDMDLAEAMVKSVIGYVLEHCPDELAFFNQFIDKGLLERLRHVADSDFARVTYTEAVDVLAKNNENFQYKVEWGCDLQTEHERYLTEQVYQKPVFVTDYPKEIKSFYMRQNEDGKTVAAADMLVPGIGELIGGSQREERLDLLTARMEELGMEKADYEWYLDLRRFGSVKHAGFGLGFERLVMYLTGIQNIRDVLPFPRTTGGF